MPSLRRHAAVEDGLAYCPLCGSDHVKTTTVETAERGRSPLGAHTRFLIRLDRTAT